MQINAGIFFVKSERDISKLCLLNDYIAITLVRSVCKILKNLSVKSRTETDFWSGVHACTGITLSRKFLKVFIENSCDLPKTKTLLTIFRNETGFQQHQQTKYCRNHER